MFGGSPPSPKGRGVDQSLYLWERVVTEGFAVIYEPGEGVSGFHGMLTFQFEISRAGSDTLSVSVSDL